MVVVRTFSWIVILGRQGVLNQIVLALGLSDEPLRLLFTETAGGGIYQLQLFPFSPFLRYFRCRPLT